MNAAEADILMTLDDLAQVEAVGCIATSRQHLKSVVARLVASGHVVQVPAYKLTAKGRRWLDTQEDPNDDSWKL